MPDDTKQINSHASNPTAPEDKKWYNPRRNTLNIHVATFSLGGNEANSGGRPRFTSLRWQRHADWPKVPLDCFLSFLPVLLAPHALCE